MGMHHMGMHGMHGMMHPMMGGMGMQQQQPLVQVNDMSKHGSSADSADRRRLQAVQQEMDDFDDDTEKLTIEKCLVLEALKATEVCVTRDPQGAVSVEYTTRDGAGEDEALEVAVGTVETEEWRV